jgi:pullulanase/glycogen debranching enzyme
MSGAIAPRISGICSIYQHSGHLRINSIHVANRHDGLTLNDLLGCKGGHEAKGEGNLHCILNSGREELPFDLPPIEGQEAYRVVDTGMESPNDVVDPGQETAAADNTIIARNRSVVVLISK